jgi:hypothetical protein
VAEQALARVQLQSEQLGEELRIQHGVALVGGVGGLVFFRDQPVVQVGSEKDAVLENRHYEGHRVVDQQRRQGGGDAPRLEVARHLVLDQHAHALERRVGRQRQRLHCRPHKRVHVVADRPDALLLRDRLVRPVREEVGHVPGVQRDEIPALGGYGVGLGRERVDDGLQLRRVPTLQCGLKLRAYVFQSLRALSQRRSRAAVDGEQHEGQRLRGCVER